MPEDETCGDDVNGGCNMEPGTENFELINAGDVICGTAWSNTSLRDTDWYELTITDWKTIYWTVEAEFPVDAFILSSDCNDLVYHAFNLSIYLSVIDLNLFLFDNLP